MKTNDIREQIIHRNALRKVAGLPLLNDREVSRLNTAQELRVLENAFVVERIRFAQEWTANHDGFLSNSCRWSRARQVVAKEMKMGQHIQHLFAELGYRLVEDVWETDGRCTYLNDEDADRPFLRDLESTLAAYGFNKDSNRLRTFIGKATGEMIEVEPGGADTSGHFLHHLKWNETSDGYDHHPNSGLL